MGALQERQNLFIHLLLALLFAAVYLPENICAQDDG